ALLDVGDHRLDGELDAALEIHRVHAGGHRLGAFLDDGVRQHGRGRGAVAGLVVGLLRHLAHHLRAHVLELVFELDLLGDGNAVLGDARRAEALVEHDVAALRAERHLHGVGEHLDAVQHAVAGFGGKSYVFGSHSFAPGMSCLSLRTRNCVQATTPMMSDSFMMRSSSPSILTSVPDHLPNSTRSPALTSIGMSLPASSRPPGPTATISPSCGFSLAVSGMMMPPLVFSSASIRLTTTRSCSGRNFSFAMITLRCRPCGAAVAREMPSFRLFQWVSTQ